MLTKTKHFPRPHQLDNSWTHSIDSATESVIYPLAMYDEAQGVPSSYYSNPEHASFVQASEPNCYPDSRINSIITEMTISLTKGALETDKLHYIRLAFMPIYMAFKENYTAIDELSSTEVQDVLYMQTEATDQQGYPLWSGTKITEKFTNSAVLATNVPGLTTNQIMEKVNFNTETYYDALHFQTIAGKLKNSQGGLKWITLTKDRPVAKFRIRLRSKTKRMNPYTFFGLLVTTPKVDTQLQIPVGGDTTAIPHVNVQVRARFNEWHQSFYSEKV